MNIKQAKEELKHTIEAYMKKDEYGRYRIEAVRQRPVLLMGPPGIGKTAIMEQIAKECGIGLVSYTITHHTRQSAIGLPFIEKKEHIAFSEFKLDLDVLLSKIDRLYRLKLHGGEVFLHPELCEMVNYADSLKKIKSIRVATNGTVIPSEKVLKVLAASKAVVQISDYPAFSGKAEKIAELFRMYGVKYVKLTGQKWRDMGEIKKRETNRFKSCSITRCTSLYRRKIYVCSRAAMMEELGCHFYDGIDIASDKRTLRRDILRIYNGEHCKACFYCDGDTDFAEEIPAGKQLL